MSALQKTPLRKTGRKCLQYIYLTKDLYPLHTKNSYNSIKRKNNPIKKFKKRSAWLIHERHT